MIRKNVLFLLLFVGIVSDTKPVEALKMSAAVGLGVTVSTLACHQIIARMLPEYYIERYSRYLELMFIGKGNKIEHVEPKLPNEVASFNVTIAPQNREKSKELEGKTFYFNAPKLGVIVGLVEGLPKSIILAPCIALLARIPAPYLSQLSWQQVAQCVVISGCITGLSTWYYAHKLQSKKAELTREEAAQPDYNKVFLALKGGLELFGLSADLEYSPQRLGVAVFVAAMVAKRMELF